ncbi:MAG: hypothetical protein LIO63_04150 [Akkermansia sp.]|nr:hypothetical protein [Akkermansia sp.]
MAFGLRAFPARQKTRAPIRVEGENGFLPCGVLVAALVAGAATVPCGAPARPPFGVPEEFAPRPVGVVVAAHALGVPHRRRNARLAFRVQIAFVHGIAPSVMTAHPFGAVHAVFVAETPVCVIVAHGGAVASGVVAQNRSRIAFRRFPAGGGLPLGVAVFYAAEAVVPVVDPDLLRHAEGVLRKLAVDVVPALFGISGRRVGVSHGLLSRSVEAGEPVFPQEFPLREPSVGIVGAAFGRIAEPPCLDVLSRCVEEGRFLQPSFGIVVELLPRHPGGVRAQAALRIVVFAPQQSPPFVVKEPLLRGSAPRGSFKFAVVVQGDHALQLFRIIQKFNVLRQ